MLIDVQINLSKVNNYTSELTYTCLELSELMHCTILGGTIVVIVKEMEIPVQFTTCAQQPGEHSSPACVSMVSCHSSVSAQTLSP